MGTWNVLFPVDKPTITLSQADNNAFTFEGMVSGYLSSSNYNDTYPVYLQPGYRYDFITVNSGAGYGNRGSGLYGVWTDILIYDSNGDLLDINRALSSETIGYNGDIFDFQVSTAGTYYVSESMYFTWDSGSYTLAINIDPPTGGGITTTTPTVTTPTLETHTFTGTSGADMLTGTSGDDLFYARGGTDSINGGAGADQLILEGDCVSNVTGIETISGGAGIDFILLGNENATITVSAVDILAGGSAGSTWPPTAATASSRPTRCGCSRRSRGRPSDPATYTSRKHDAAGGTYPTHRAACSPSGSNLTPVLLC